MPCRTYTSDDGEVRAIVCSRGGSGPRKFCVVCLKDGRKTPAPFLCDHPKPEGGTCDAGLCATHTNRVRVGVDWCPSHGEPKP